MKTLAKWWSWLAAAASAVVALVLVLASSRHEKKQGQLIDKAIKLEDTMDSSIEDYNAAAKRAEAAGERASAAVKEAEVRIDEIRKVDTALAERVDRYKRRRLQRRGS